VDLLKTDSTFASRQRALAKLERACGKTGLVSSKLRFVIAVNDNGRFAPVVVFDGKSETLALAHQGVTVVS